MKTCNICSSESIKSIYNGLLRTGSFGKQTSKNYDLFFCSNCKSKFIDDILPRDYYDSPQYRIDYNNTINIKEFYKEYDTNDTNKISKIGLHNLRDQIIADFGSAAGTFLQAVSNISKYTIAIEPSKHFHETLKEYNKYVYSYGKDLVQSNNKINIATSFDVIEHVTSPIDYLKEIYKSLENGGKLYLKTPNFTDLLHELSPEEYDKFNFRTAHLYYFCIDSLEYILKRSGFKEFTIKYTHDYDMSNLIYWMKDKKPTGMMKTNLFDEGFNLMYKNYLEENKIASHLWVEAIK